MALSSEARADLVAAVGEEYVATDPSILMSHAWNNILGSDIGANKLSIHPPSAIVMPDGVEEVQRIVQACNRHGLRFRAFSTGWMTPPSSPNSVYIDLARMNRIIKFDVENQMAVIEPGVTAGVLQAEALKHGLTSHVVGAGPTHSPLASAAAFHGMGISGATTGINGRNLLSTEWVTPDGRIVRLGSAGQTDRWFSSDGPGPGWRGMIRGVIGTTGSLGVFTRIGYKLYPWAEGPLRSTGSLPQVGMELRSTSALYQLRWDRWEDAAQAAHDMLRAAIVFSFVRMPVEAMGGLLTASSTEYGMRSLAGTLPEAARLENRIQWTVLTLADSNAQAEYQAQVMHDIIQRTHGSALALTESERGVMARNLATSCYVQRAIRPNLIVTMFGIMDSFSLLPRVIERAQSLEESDRAKGLFSKPGPESSWVWPTEGRYMWLENTPLFNIRNPKGMAAAVRYMLRASFSMVKKPLGTNGFLAGPLYDLFGPYYHNINRYLRRIKNTLDPNGLGETGYYVTAKMNPVTERVVPKLMNLLFSRLGAPILKVVTDLKAASRKN